MFMLVGFEFSSFFWGHFFLAHDKLGVYLVFILIFLCVFGLDNYFKGDDVSCFKQTPKMYNIT
jgi:hypothetical protein